MKNQDTSLNWTKLAGILSPVQEHLAPRVWNLGNQKLRSEVKLQILKRIKKVIPLEDIKDLYILGSITGFKWTEHSDVDVMVLVDNLEQSKEKTKATKKINEINLDGTQHPVNFFLSEWNEDTEKKFQEADFGVYSVVFDKWVKSPGNYNDVRNPQHEYWSELILARAEARQFERMAVELENDKKDLKALEKARKKAGDLLTFDALKRKRREIGEGYKNLHEFVAQIDKDRKFSYSTGWGVGREMENNIVFKFIEHGPYGKLFQELKETQDWKKLYANK